MNQGEAQALRNQFEENNVKGEGLEVRNQNALENMSEVASQVQTMLQLEIEGGLGQKVREIAQAQNQAQEQIQEQVEKLNNRHRVWRWLFGSDQKTVSVLNQQLEQNRLRVQTLQQLQTQLVNQADKTAIEEAIQAMVEQNTALQTMLEAENRIKGLFGWLIKLFQPS